MDNLVYRYVAVQVSRPCYYPVYPDGVQSIYLNSERAFVASAIEKSLILPMLPGRYFGIWFYPGVAAANKKLIPTMHSALGVHGIHPIHLPEVLAETLQAAPSLASFKLVADNLLTTTFSDTASSAATKNKKFEAQLQLSSLNSTSASVAEFAKQLGVSERHANRLSHQHSGLSAKKLLNLRQLQRAAQSILHATPAIDVATQHGFYDQAHLINKFRRFYGSTPQTFQQSLMSEISNTLD
ncbi:AraC family transcriptional regulator [Salinibius halmophilus]|uniref:AraC family transcriptional regulator n=1 Tax=Salinibius halmophilus TaxID=1853216 RepID=UPI0013140523|nr:helix-turn-helix domain-containing protein [Salinibius halmophilus]